MIIIFSPWPVLYLFTYFFVTSFLFAIQLPLRRTLVRSIPKGFLWDNSVHLFFSTG